MGGRFAADFAIYWIPFSDISGELKESVGERKFLKGKNRFANTCASSVKSLRFSRRKRKFMAVVFRYTAG